MADELGPDVPLHFTAFHPDYKLRELPRTPVLTLTRARTIAREQGLRYVYTGNVHDTEGGTTFCPGCGAVLVQRDWHLVTRCDLAADARCLHCATPVAGHFGPFEGGFGRRRIPLHQAALHSG